ncbi:hypothetical protein BKA59DRAFT_434707 [Fusarium tricinctum]|uniref:Uncharacterized protein n=1 Tax=Fusarium tricinctum TaxID=61284 RepID=A0A8K0RZ21_9HYPO|nr:hypothetical protein BKA59DRAFT_434707 [Fusarium tricinctum]
MLTFGRIAQLHIILCCLLTLCLAKDDENYDNSTNFRPRNVTGLGDFYQWVGSYYNATAEVELKPVFGDVWNETLFGPEYTDNLCYKLKNSTHTAKYDAILSVLEKGEWNAGSNSVVFWLTLIPKSLAGFNVSSLGPDFMYSSQSNGLQFPLFSVHPSPDGYWRPRDGKGPDLFNFTTSQTKSGAYNLSAIIDRNKAESYSSNLNLTMPVCNTTELSGDYMISMQEFQSWQAEGWDDFRYPSMSIQFDGKTANLTMDAVFSATPYVQSNVSDWQGPTTGDPGAHGFIQIRVSGAIDAYHSDSLSLEDETPVWLRTVGFGNDSSNIGYDSGAIKFSSGSTLAIVAIAISIAVVI